jgi:mycothiol synthase
MTFQRAPYTGEADLQPITDLFNACEAVDHLEEGTSVSELRAELEAPEYDKERDISLWRGPDGQLQGFARLWKPEIVESVEGRLVFKVHPQVRQSDLGAQCIAWGEDRLREVAQAAGKPAILQVRVAEQDAEKIALLEQQGFSIVRYYLTMARSLAEPIPEPVLPPGFSLRQTNGQTDAEAWVAMFNESFIDHWNHHPLTVEQFEYGGTAPDYRADLDMIAIAPDGTFAAFCYSSIYPEENQRSGRNDGWIEVLGTRRGYRKIGLGRAMLRVGLQRLKAAGVESARLNVDAESLTGATRLYESEGFQPVATKISYVKHLQ